MPRPASQKSNRLLSDIRISNAEPAVVVGHSVLRQPSPETLDANGGSPVPPAGFGTIPGGKLMAATAKAFGAKAVEATIAELSDGSVETVFDLAEDNFELGMLFKNFRIPIGDQLIFDDVKVALLRKGRTSKIEFTGVLRMTSSLLRPFRKFADTDKGLMLTAEFDLESGESAGGKVQMRDVRFKSALGFSVNVSEDVIFNSLVFQLHMKKQDDGTGWEIIPSFSGSLMLAELLDDDRTEPLDCEIRLEDKTLIVSASTDEVGWKMAGLRVAMKDVSVEFEAGKSKSIEVESKLKVGRRELGLAGVLKPDFMGVRAYAEKFTLKDLGSLFTEVSGVDLIMPDFPVKFEEVVIGVASDEGSVGEYQLEQGVSLSGTVTVHGHTCTATALLQADGVSFSGELNNIQLGPVEIIKPRLEMQFYTARSSRAARFAIVGSAKIEGVTVECKLAYERNAGQWTALVYAGLDASEFGLSRVIPAVKGSDVENLRFNKVAFVYASKDHALKDPDFGFKARKGLQLIGEVDGIPGLDKLSGSEDGGIILSAQFGNDIAIGLTMPESTRLDLGNAVSCDPFSARVVLVPVPEVQLVFGMDVTVPDQDSPLHFDLMLAVGPLEASGSGTMKGYWINPFGLKPLKIGPALALEIGVNYAQLAASGTPSKLAFAGGLVLGDVEARMAASVSTNPMDMILSGKLAELSPENLIAFVNDASGADIDDDAVPDFFELNNLELVCAPAGGNIGTINYDRGFSFACDMVLFDKAASAFFRLGDDGFKAEAHLDELEIGPLRIGGKRGDDMLLDVELTTARQVIKIDAELEFAGSEVGVFVDVSNAGVEFDFDWDFLGVTTYSIHGVSTGSLDDPKSLDFQLTAEFQNELTHYLKTEVSDKISRAVKVVETDISRLQADLDQSKQAWEREFDPLQRHLDATKVDADRYLKQLKSSLQQEKKKLSENVRNAQAEVARAKKAYNDALRSAEHAVTRAQSDYDRAMRSAQGDVTKAQRDYDTALRNAEAEVKRAEAKYQRDISGAQNKIAVAQKEVNKLRRQRNNVKRELDRTSGWRFDRKASLGIQLAGLETALFTATQALNAAKGFLGTVGRGTGWLAFQAAQKTLEGVRYGGKYGALESARQVLEATRYGGKYGVLDGAKKTLSAVRNGTEYTAWQGAEGTLRSVESVGRAAVTGAQNALNGFGRSAVSLAFESAKLAVEAAKKGTAFASFETARIALEGGKQGAKAALKVGEAVTRHAGDIVDIKRVKLSASLKNVQRGKLFDAEIEASVLGKECDLDINFDVNEVDDFIEKLFVDAFGQAKKLIA